MAPHTLASTGEWTTNDLEGYRIRIEEQPAAEFFGGSFHPYTGPTDFDFLRHVRAPATQSSGLPQTATVDASSNTLLNLLSLASQPPCGPNESAVPDLAVEILRTVGFEATAPSAVARTRKAMKMIVQGNSSYVTVDACLQDAASGTVLLLVDEDRRYSGKPADPEARLVAKAIAAYQHNVGVRRLDASRIAVERNSRSARQSEPFSIPGIIMFGTSPRLYRISVTPSLDDAVRHGRTPDVETTVHRHTPRVPGQWNEGLCALENRMMILRCLENLIPLAELLAENLGINLASNDTYESASIHRLTDASTTPTVTFTKAPASIYSSDGHDSEITPVSHVARKKTLSRWSPESCNNPTSEMLKAREWRYKVQKMFFGNSPLKHKDMPDVDSFFEIIEQSSEMSVPELEFSKIPKVMLHIARLEEDLLPRDDEFHFRERAMALYQKWTDALEVSKQSKLAAEPQRHAAKTLSEGPKMQGDDAEHHSGDSEETYTTPPSSVSGEVVASVAGENAKHEDNVLKPQSAKSNPGTSVSHGYPPTPPESVSCSQSANSISSKRDQAWDPYGPVGLACHKVSVWKQVLGDAVRLVNNVHKDDVARVRCMANMGVVNATLAGIEAYDVETALSKDETYIDDDGRRQGYIQSALSEFLPTMRILAYAADGIIPLDRELRIRERAHAIVEKWSPLLDSGLLTPTTSPSSTAFSPFGQATFSAPTSASTLTSFGSLDDDADSSDSFCMVDDVPRAV